MSALAPKADMCGATAQVRFGPKADIAATLIGAPKKRGASKQANSRLDCFRSVSKPASIGTGCKLDGMQVQPRPAGLPREALLQRRRSTRRHSNHWDGISRKDHGERQPRIHQQLERPNCLELDCS